eukprot:gene6557-7601_t
MQIYINNSSFETVDDPTSVFQKRHNKCFKSLINYFLRIKPTPKDDALNESVDASSFDKAEPEDKTLEASGSSMDIDNDDEDHNQDNDKQLFTQPEAKSFGFDPKMVYDHVAPRDTDTEYPRDQLAGITSTLKSYQLKTVRWMVDRELKPEVSLVYGQPALHMLWRRIEIAGQTFYYNEFTGRLSATPVNTPVSVDVRGGILADEPGIGKTVEFLGLVVAHPKPDPTPIESKRPSAAPLVDPDELMAIQVVQPPPIQEYTNEDGETVACICGRDEASHGFSKWVECDTCKRWQSVACVGRRYSILNDYYFCSFCTDPKRKRAEAQLRMAKAAPAQWTRETMVEAKTTLIVVPPPIFAQWIDEIKKHAGALVVRAYHGIYKDVVSPLELAAADIVLTTYDVLASEAHCVAPLRTTNVLRYVKVEAPTSPLTCIKFWRICLDEAQMVVSSTSMALRLESTYRWALSGTPIGRKLDDLHDFVAFIGLGPLADKFWWKHAISAKYAEDAGVANRLHDMLQVVMRRTNKAHVADELHLPPQRDKDTRLLVFSMVERFYYRRKADTCSREARALFTRAFSGGSDASSRDISRILQPLLVLRQTCQHPQVGSKGARSLQKNTMTMDELLERLIENASLECKNAQKDYIHALNCLAAAQIIKANHNGAAELYREALSLVEGNAHLYKADWFQQLHILHNLAYLVKEGKLTVHTLRDDSFAKEAEQVRVAYQRQKNGSLVKVLETWTEAKEKVDEMLDDFDERSKQGEWWTLAIQLLDRQGMRDTLFTRITNELTQPNVFKHNQHVLLNKFKETHGLIYLITNYIYGMHGDRSKFMTKLSPLSSAFTEADVERSVNCAACSQAKARKGPQCGHCEARQLMVAYKERLFSAKHKTEREKAIDIAIMDDDDEEGGGGLKEDDKFLLRDEGTTTIVVSEVEITLKLLASMVKPLDADIAEDGQHHLETLDNMKQELRAATRLWSTSKDYLNSFDEVDSAITRIRLRYQGEIIGPREELFTLRPIELDPFIERFQAERKKTNDKYKESNGIKEKVKGI